MIIIIIIVIITLTRVVKPTFASLVACHLSPFVMDQREEWVKVTGDSTSRPPNRSEKWEVRITIEGRTGEARIFVSSMDFCLDEGFEESNGRRNESALLHSKLIEANSESEFASSSNRINLRDSQKRKMLLLLFHSISAPTGGEKHNWIDFHLHDWQNYPQKLRQFIWLV